MKILLLHNQYRIPGGEDVAFDMETQLLKAHGHDVTVLRVRNQPKLNGPKAAVEATWSREWRKVTAAVLKGGTVDLVHLHNFFPQLSPAVYFACNEAGVPVVQTLHNYRLICPSALLWRDGAPCNYCVGRPVAWPGVLHKCYRNSRAGTAAVAAMLMLHRAGGTWSERVNQYIALTEFAKRMFVEGGLPEDKISVKPNPVYPDPGAGPISGRGGAVFVGRFSEEKGIKRLIEAWTQLRDVPLTAIGVGPLYDEIAHDVHRLDLAASVEVKGSVDRQTVMRLLKGAKFLVFPSEVYEGFPMAIAEAFACGTPVVGANLGACGEIIEDQVTGILFEPGNVEDMVRKVRFADKNDDVMLNMGRVARERFDTKYSAEVNYEKLLGIYRTAQGA